MLTPRTAPAADQLDTEIVAAALERRLASGLADGLDPCERFSLSISLTTATIPVLVERGPHDDSSCRWIFDQPQVHDDGTVEYRTRWEHVRS
jgi:hypothetical protein